MASFRHSLKLFLLFALAGCGSSAAETTPAPTASPIEPAVVETRDVEGDDCKARVSDAMRSERAPGAPLFEANRIAILGRARAEPMVFVRAPSAVAADKLSPDAQKALADFTKARPGGRVISLVKRLKNDRPTLRALLLREGYVYTDEPQDALLFAAEVKLADLFDEPAIFLQRGQSVSELARVQEGKEVKYVYTSGPLASLPADVIFGDRVALARAELSAPLHRDLAALADEQGFDRTAIVHLSDGPIVADLRFGTRKVRSLLESKGAALNLSCVAEDKEIRAEVSAFQKQTAPRRRAMSAIREAVTTLVSETMRFDRPLDEKGPDKDGQLRPAWMTAYLQGREFFNHEGRGYPVFDTKGRAWPPEVCVDFVLDSFERAGGTWFRPKGEALGRNIGRFTWVDDIRQVRGVIGLGDKAAKHPELFDVRRFVGNERIQFGERARFFKFLEDHADEIKPGDIVSIHGYKRDERIHQHAIFVERTDPITGFAFGLADQMRKPRRRTWEGIMAEAPKRSLLFRIHPKDVIFSSIDPGDPVASR
ncbi:MAG: hypothetical protein IPK82_09535 [Polyangiaceae bacterium]|nr:hypothetical protein [Polyangiaceae bacterium]